MIFVANKTREIEKKNNNLKIEITKISENVKINKIELITHHNSSYLNKLYNLYFSELKKNNIPNVVSIKQFVKQDKNIELISSDN